MTMFIAAVIYRIHQCGIMRYIADGRKNYKRCPGRYQKDVWRPGLSTSGSGKSGPIGLGVGKIVGSKLLLENRGLKKFYLGIGRLILIVNL